MKSTNFARLLFQNYIAIPVQQVEMSMDWSQQAWVEAAGRKPEHMFACFFFCHVFENNGVSVSWTASCRGASRLFAVKFTSIYPYSEPFVRYGNWIR